MPDRGPSLLISFHASAPSPLPYLSHFSMPRCSPVPVIICTARRRGGGDGGGLEGRGWGVSGHTLYLGWIERRYSRCWRFAAGCKQTHTWHATYTNTSTAEVRAFHLSPTNGTRPQAPPSSRQQHPPPPPPPPSHTTTTTRPYAGASPTMTPSHWGAFRVGSPWVAHTCAPYVVHCGPLSRALSHAWQKHAGAWLQELVRVRVHVCASDSAYARVGSLALGRHQGALPRGPGPGSLRASWLEHVPHG